MNTFGTGAESKVGFGSCQPEGTAPVPSICRGTGVGNGKPAQVHPHQTRSSESRKGVTARRDASELLHATARQYPSRQHSKALPVCGWCLSLGGSDDVKAPIRTAGVAGYRARVEHGPVVYLLYEKGSYAHAVTKSPALKPMSSYPADSERAGLWRLSYE